MGVLSAVEIALQPASVALALGGEGWSPPPKLTPRTKALLAELAARPFSEDDKLIRASPNAAALLSWGGKATVQDLALSVLLLDDHGGWLLLPKPARESWIAQLPPLLTEERASAPRDLLRNVIFAAAATLDSVDASEASALERRVAADGWPPDWVSVRFLAAVGLLNAGRDAREVVVRMLPDAVRSSEGRRALPLVFKIWSERGWDDSNRLLSEMLNAMKMQGADEVEVLLEMEPLLESLDVRVANAAFACISDTLQQERFASEPRLQGLRERARRVTV